MSIKPPPIALASLALFVAGIVIGFSAQECGDDGWRDAAVRKQGIAEGWATLYEMASEREARLSDGCDGRIELYGELLDRANNRWAECFARRKLCMDAHRWTP